MAYTQQHQYTYRDSLEKGDAEKVIKGEYFDDEFSAIEASIGSIPGSDGGDIAPDAPGYGSVVFQDRTEDQQVVSKFTFAVDGQEPLTVENTGIWAGTDDYVKYVSAEPAWQIRPVLRVQSPLGESMAYTGFGVEKHTDAYISYSPALGGPTPSPEQWIVKPGLEVDGHLDVSGDTHLEGALEVDGNAQLNADLNVSGELDVIGGITAGGDLTLNGNIIIDGGTIVDPDGNTSGGFWSPSGAEFIRYTFPSGGDGLQAGGIEIHNEVTDNVWYWEGFGSYCRIGRRGGTAYLRIDGDGDLLCGHINSGGQINADKFIKDGGTASQLLCADGSVVAKTDYYTKTQADARYVQLTGNQTIAGTKTFSSTIAGSINGNAATVTNGVYTAGNQTIAGIKTFNSDIRCKANVYAYYGSDERLKDDITPMPVGLIDAIEPATWKWKEDGQSSAGVVAQQLQQAGLGDWVREAPNGDLGVDYNALIGMLIAEVQDLKRRLSDG